MKIKVKYTDTKKFIITLPQHEPTLADLKDNVIKFISENYGVTNLKFAFSLNGKDPIIGNEKESLTSLGIVNGDLLTVILDTPTDRKQTTEFSSSATKTSPVSAKVCLPSKTLTESKEDKSFSMDMEKSNESLSETLSGNTVATRDNGASKVTSLSEAEDGHPPAVVIEAFEQYSPTSASQVLTLLTHITMLESGFFVQDGQNSVLKTLPISWKDMVTTIQYHHPGFNKFDCTIVLVTMGNIKQVLASFEGQESELSVKFNTNDYLQSNQVLPHRLTKLSQFSKTLKNKLLYPLQVAAHETLGLPAPWHLAGLPHELVILIASCLDLKSILNLALSCKRLDRACEDNKLWFIIFKRDFPDHSHSSDKVSGADWKAKYITIYKRTKSDRLKENRQRPYAVPFNEPVDPRNIHRPNPVPCPPPFGSYPAIGGPYYPPQPDFPDGPFWDPDNPYFGGDIRPPFNPLPYQPGPLGRGMPRPPYNPFQPPFRRPGFNPDFSPRFI